jgi:hypothetical protein
VRITRTRTVKARTTRATAYLVVSLPAEHAQPADLGLWARREWHIENKIHYVRDVTLREDAHQARTGNGPAVFATLRNTAIGYHRINGETNIAQATRRANRRPDDLITLYVSVERLPLSGCCRLVGGAGQGSASIASNAARVLAAACRHSSSHPLAASFDAKRRT